MESKKISALTFNIKEDGWETSKGFIKREIDMPVLDEAKNPKDALSVILKIKYAGVCGSDRGIYNRQAFKDLIFSSLQKENKDMRILGHEFFGEIQEMGSQVSKLYSLAKGDNVSGDSHVTCGECYQCKIGENNVCTNEAILGISIDGIFAEYVKIPAKNLWKVNPEKVRPEICAIYDPFGNAVHAVSKTKTKNQTVAIFGAGPIGLFSVALQKHFGASKIIAVDINAQNLAMAKKMGADETILIAGNEDASEKIKEMTDGVGVDIAMEMAGPISCVLACINSARRGGHVILFGIKDGDFTIPGFSRIITKGLTMHGVIGRRIFETWKTSDQVLSDKSNGVQDKIWEVILKKGEGTILPFENYKIEDFEKSMQEHPKVIFKF
ncbi:MAG: hypothetical protein A3D48_04200 [Candidatus Yanofskybacteria bacterium RIFCSPHIGHO2_02_FULL_43_17]|nr:MAG: hypothetical protein A3D48_04200 [Candidatus Yanofskybacteria bacterium RIFCSPHIGHO2_02_FULL_43_17]